MLTTIDKEHIAQIIQLESKMYGENHTRTVEQLSALIAKQPRGILTISDRVGSIVGATDIWSLKACYYQSLSNGILREEDIEPSWLLDNGGLSSLYYIGSMIVDPDQNLPDRLSSTRILKGKLSEYITREMKTKSTINILGVVSTDAGRGLALKWGMKKVPRGPFVFDSRQRVEMILSGNRDLPFSK